MLRSEAGTSQHWINSAFGSTQISAEHSALLSRRSGREGRSGYLGGGKIPETPKRKMSPRDSDRPQRASTSTSSCLRPTVAQSHSPTSHTVIYNIYSGTPCLHFAPLVTHPKEFGVPKAKRQLAAGSGSRTVFNYWCVRIIGIIELPSMRSCDA